MKSNNTRLQRFLWLEKDGEMMGGGGGGGIDSE